MDAEAIKTRKPGLEQTSGPSPEADPAGVPETAASDCVLVGRPAFQLPAVPHKPLLALTQLFVLGMELAFVGSLPRLNSFRPVLAPFLSH